MMIFHGWGQCFQFRLVLWYCCLSDTISFCPELNAALNVATYLLRPWERWWCIVMSKSVCVCVCVSVHEHISRAIFTKFFVHVAYCHGSVSPILVGWQNPKGRGNFGGFLFFPIDNALYSIAFGTHTKTAEPIEMPFGFVTQVGPRYHVLDRGPDPPWEKGNYWGKCSSPLWSNGTLYIALCINGSINRRAILDEDLGGPNEWCTRWGCRSPEGSGNFWGCPGHSKALAVLLHRSLRRSLQKGSFNRQ